MTYPRAHSYLNSFINYEKLNLYPYKSSFKLERMRRLLQLLDNPHKALRVIHIAGTKGKGSTCAFVANILKAAGFKVGLYTSPHLIDVRERIGIEDKISKKDFARLIKKIRPYAEKLRDTKLGRLSYYEILTALAFLYFKEAKVDFAVLETGVGGRLDATNAASSLICALAPISYEHTRVLGTTLSRIATEKTGIIKKRNQIVITAPQSPAALKVIRRQAGKFGAKLVEVGKDIQITENSSNLYGHCFDVKGVFAEYPRLKIKLLGKHQIVNAAVAVGCAESLRYFGFKVSRKAIREGLKNTRWPGRLQIISRRPKIIVDAAHNQASARALTEALNKLFKFRKLTLIFAVSQDKDVRGILRELIPLANNTILTSAENPRAMAPETIKSFITTNSRAVTLTNDSAQALKIARENAAPQDLILVCGSLFLVGEILEKCKRIR